MVTRILKWRGGADVGCKRDAIAAANGTLPYLDRGACRKVYSGARSIVYKVATSGDNRANVSEYERMDRIAQFDRTLATPSTVYFVTVNGQEVAVLAQFARPNDSRALDPNTVARFYDRVARYNAENPFGDKIGDMHGGNFRSTPMGRATITDCGDVIIGGRF